MTRYAGVKRTVVVEYHTPVAHYDGMTEDEIRAFEREDNSVADAPEIYLENIVSEGVEVYFYDKDESDE